MNSNCIGSFQVGSRLQDKTELIFYFDKMLLDFFFGRRRLKKRSEKTEIARPKRKHRKRKREGASVREDSQPPPPGLETCSSSRRKSSRVWGTNKTRISRNRGGVQEISREIQERKTRWQQPERHVSEICGHRPKE